MIATRAATAVMIVALTLVRVASPAGAGAVPVDDELFPVLLLLLAPPPLLLLGVDDELPPPIGVPEPEPVEEEDELELGGTDWGNANEVADNTGLVTGLAIPNTP